MHLGAKGQKPGMLCKNQRQPMNKLRGRHPRHFDSGMRWANRPTAFFERGIPRPTTFFARMAMRTLPHVLPEVPLKLSERPCHRTTSRLRRWMETIAKIEAVRFPDDLIGHDASNLRSWLRVGCPATRRKRAFGLQTLAGQRNYTIEYT